MPHRTPIRWEYQLNYFREVQLPHEREMFNAWSRRNRNKRNAVIRNWRNTHQDAYRRQNRKDQMDYRHRKQIEAQMDIEQAIHVEIPQSEDLTHYDIREIMKAYANGKRCEKDLKQIMQVVYKLGFMRGAKAHEHIL